jgi:hypothetical protein
LYQRQSADHNRNETTPPEAVVLDLALRSALSIAWAAS